MSFFSLSNFNPLNFGELRQNGWAPGDCVDTHRHAVRQTFGELSRAGANVMTLGLCSILLGMRLNMRFGWIGSGFVLHFLIGLQRQNLQEWLGLPDPLGRRLVACLAGSYSPATSRTYAWGQAPENDVPLAIKKNHAPDFGRRLHRMPESMKRG